MQQQQEKETYVLNRMDVALDLTNTKLEYCEARCEARCKARCEALFSVSHRPQATTGQTPTPSGPNPTGHPTASQGCEVKGQISGQTSSVVKHLKWSNTLGGQTP